jgi:hypothetical protein
VQTEIPLVKQTLSDVVRAVRGAGVHGERYDRRTGESVPLTLRPSGATSPVHGFAQLARFVPGARDVLAAVDDDVAFAVLPATTDGRALMFEDQYLCTGGELYELMAGHDRYTADVRPLTAALLDAPAARRSSVPTPTTCVRRSSPPRRASSSPTRPVASPTHRSTC